LRQREEQRQIAVDAFALQDFAGADAFPGARDLDEDALAPDAALFIERDEAAALVNKRLGVEDRFASVSVETRPGTIFKISSPNAMSRWSTI